VHNEDTSSNTWIQPVLARHLGQTTAPAGLWERVTQPRVRQSAISNSRLVWAFAAVLLVAVLLWGFHPRAGASVENQALQFRSDEPGQVQRWVKANTGLEVPLHASPSARLIGASAVSGPVPAARIVYRVGSDNVALMVANVGAAPALATGKRDSIFSWTARGQRYTVACADAEELRIGCLLCHAGA
jgi:hypothetical protein